MEFKQSTFGEIIDSERDMVLKGSEMYGDFFVNAFEFNNLLINFIKSVDAYEKVFFIMFLSQVRKHHTLALFSALRLHHVQMGMNLRQVMENGAWAAYGLGNNEEEKFVVKLPNGVADVPDKLRKARDKWLDDNFKVKSDEFKNLKGLINSSVAHANVVYTFQNFEMKPKEDAGFNLPFFDFYDEYKVKGDLWFVANTGLGLLDLFYGANQQYNVFQFVDDFLPKYKALVKQNNELKQQMTSTDRYKTAWAISPHNPSNV